MSYPELERCIEVVRKLRDPQGGCPWDLEQTHQSLLPYLLEESYEYIEAVEKAEPALMREELGDVLLQVLLHSVIAEQGGRFDLEGVARALADKLIHRHPHVFGEKVPGLDPAAVKARWDEQKKAEKAKAGIKASAIPDKLLHHPSLKTAYLIGVASGKVAFDWEDHLQVLYKVEEEWQEVKEELSVTGKFNPERVAEELGDLLFSVAQLARHLGVEPEAALRAANKKFLKRFHKVEDLARDRGQEVGSMTQPQMEELWVVAKEQTK